MTKTLVERLRERSPQIDLNEGDGGLMGEAADRIEKLEAALRPFADIADLLDSETEGVSDTDEMNLYLYDYLAGRYEAGDFRTARAALNGE